ncbi:penicillin-binding protein 2 [Endomicrobium proavitum]|uniref:Peptidoglycan glycosyltransferase/penicillin-binding protein 2 n=1 Tax=Endomicrobium proavitum TaxID=1408281 RepID=A0A0G3WLG2_9BACT|nr:penicillin-binding protein 2 [Endomicrobium proavitum]AKL98702.1 peptidoglycan glycosyltransferase/penicillin-binding protein 2 [Endomicrobium proavitum]
MVWQREDNYAYEFFLEKHKIILVFFALLFLLISARIFYLQVVKGNQYRKVSEDQRIYNTRERSPRGIIYSADGTPLTSNIFTYVALFYPFEQQNEPSEETINEISKILKRDVKPAIDKSWRYGRVVKVADDLTLNEMFKIQEKRLGLNGISVVKEPKRIYSAAESVSHVTGYIGEIEAYELERFGGETYRFGDYIGKGGIEKQYNAYLHGQDGGWQLEVNARGYQTKAFKYVPIEIGDGVHLTIDLKLQNAAYDALKKSTTGRGAAVVIDPRNGAIKALVSVPGYDTNSVGTKKFATYVKDKKLPLFNRALQANYAPGSIFKIVTLIAGIELLDIDPNETDFCTGYFELGNRKYICNRGFGHGRVNMYTAMAKSCNTYFYKLGLKLGVKNIESFAKSFYLGEKTGIDLPGEKNGFVPNPDWKKSKMKMSWLQGDTVIFSIGQGALTVTPLQMADMMAAVANRGTFFKPYIVDKVVSPNGETVYTHTIKTKAPIELSADTWNLVNKALIETVESGTGKRSKLPGIKVAGKTGTAENPQGEDHAWFVTYAPADKPEIAIAVIVENGGGGGLNAVPVARKIYEAYFGLKPQSQEDKN